MNKTLKLNPSFQDLQSHETLKNHVNNLLKKEVALPHNEVLNHLLKQFEPLDFETLAFPQIEKLKAKLTNLDPTSKEAQEVGKQINKHKLNTKHFLILSIENLLQVAQMNNWGLCKNHDFIYLYNGNFWTNLNKEIFQQFLGEASEKMGVTKFTSRFYEFREKLYKQFIATGYLPTPEIPKDKVLINLQNGTFEITPNGTNLRPFDSSDFLTYQLPFKYNPDAKVPIFEKYLNQVVPDKEKQMVLAEYLGFLFIKGHNTLKEEKALILFGTGANGKSVFFEVVNALVGEENISHHSLQSLTNENGYFRAKIANKLVNYASEINGNLEASIFKQLVSGEPVEARLPYGEPFTITQYAKLIFNCNELPKDVEHTNAYFRRFLIIHFDITIPENDQDKELHNKIIASELSGVFNWVLEGLQRLLKQKRFTHCEAISKTLEAYQVQSDSVKMFLDEEGYTPDPIQSVLIKETYAHYRTFCQDDGFKPVNKSNFIKRLKGFSIMVDRKNIGYVAYLKRTLN